MSRFLVFSLLLLVACGDDDVTPADAPTADGTSDVPERPPGYRCSEADLRAFDVDVSAVVGGQRTARFGLGTNYCDDVQVNFAVVPPSLGRVTGPVVFDDTRSIAEVTFTAQEVGEGALVAYFRTRDGRIEDAESLIRVIGDNVRPSCSSSVSGRLEPGGVVTSEDGAAITLAAGAGRDDQYQVEPFDVSMSCADDQVPAGMVALGPAITFGPARRLPRDIKLTLPAEIALRPEGRELIELGVTYTGPGVPEPRSIPVASLDFSVPGVVSFEVPRLGTYQVVVQRNAPGTREREFEFRGLMGISMGGGATAQLGFERPELFDFLAPLGGPVDWVHMLHLVRNFHVGGFCTEAERATNPSACTTASTERTPPPPMFTTDQDFEHLNYVDEYEGQGGIFDRRAYLRIFRDLGLMFGSISTRRSFDPTMPMVTPSGIPDSERQRTDAERCANPVVLPGETTGGDEDPATGFFDAAYNPEGQYPVITFCDGAEVVIDGRRDVGVWDPTGNQDSPVEVTLAVDINGNGVRDAGEPVIHQLFEHFEDCGVDQVCSEDEPGYDSVLNPDPAGDDYDFQYNPTGTEANWVRDYHGAGTPACDSPNPSPAVGQGERFFDLGLDGVEGTPQLADGGFDAGEGDGCWTRAPGVASMFEQTARFRIDNLSDSVLADTNMMTDGGVRDLFGFGATEDQLAGRFFSRTGQTAMFNSHGAVELRGRIPNYSGQHYWGARQLNYHFRYGDLDASEAELIAGDGGHVGTVEQVVRRLRMTLGWMSAGWPDGNREIVQDGLCPAGSDACPDRPNVITFDFQTSNGERHPTTVVLPPGYYDSDIDYPVFYMLHGYGMRPGDLAASALLLWSEMINPTIPVHRRLQKVIFVFPNGACDNAACLRGSFYADAPEPSGGPQAGSAFFELVEHIDETYRTREPETFTVRE